MIQLRIKNEINDINREAVKISALTSGKIDKYECHTSEEALPPD